VVARKKLGIKPPWPYNVVYLLFLSFITSDLRPPAKHILGNDPSTLVLDSLKGLCELNPQLALDETSRGATGSIGSISPF
jgi:hypothetical protein